MATDMMYRYVLNGVKDGVYFVDNERRITFWNKGAEIITGFTSSEVVGRPCYENILNHVDKNGCELCTSNCPLHKTLEDGEIRDTEVYLHHKDGQRVPVSVHVMPIYEGHKIIGAVETFSEHGENSKFLSSMNELKVLAYRDQLTQLPNHRYLETTLNAKHREFIGLDIPYSVALLEIDQFDTVVDDYGQEVGVEVLQMVTKVLESFISKGDIVGRWAGGEFMFIFSEMSEKTLNMVLDEVRIMIEMSALRKGENSIGVTASIGAAVIENELSQEALIKRANDCLYQSQSTGENQVTVYL